MYQPCQVLRMSINKIFIFYSYFFLIIPITEVVQIALFSRTNLQSCTDFIRAAVRHRRLGVQHDSGVGICSLSAQNLRAPHCYVERVLRTILSASYRLRVLSLSTLQYFCIQLSFSFSSSLLLYAILLIYNYYL